MYLAGLIVLGMTRYAPFVLGLLIPVMALDSGRWLSVDRVREGDGYRARYGLPVPKQAIIPLLVVTGVNAAAASFVAFASGIEPGAYVDSMPAMTTAMVAILSGLLAFVGWLQLQPNLMATPDSEKELLAPPSSEADQPTATMAG